MQWPSKKARGKQPGKYCGGAAVKMGGANPCVTNFIQLVSPQQVDRFSQTKLHWEAPNKGYPHIYRIYKSDNK